MPLTPAQFRQALPEFKNSPGESVVQAALDEAYIATGDSWGALRDQGAKWWAADVLTASTMSEPSAKGKNASGDSAYMRRWKALLPHVRVFGTNVGLEAAIAPEPGD